MATFVQGTGVQSVGSVDSLSKAYTSNVTSGNLLVAACVSSLVTHAAGSVTDTQGNVWTRFVLRQRGSNPPAESVSLWAAVVTTGGPCTVTLDVAGSDYQTIAIAEFAPTTGMGWGIPAELADGSNGDDTGDVREAPVQTGNFTTTATGVVVGVMTHGEVGTSALTPAVGWNQIFEDENAANMPINFTYKLTDMGTYNPLWNMVDVAQWTCVGAGFKEGLPGGDAAAIRTSFKSFQKRHLKDYTDEQATEGV